MIDASRMNWAALTPSRCASRSTSAHRASAKRTVVARIGMSGTVPPTSLPLPHEYRKGPHDRFDATNATGGATFLAAMHNRTTFEAVYAQHAHEVHRVAN